MLRIALLFVGLFAYCHSFAIDANRLKCWTDGNGETSARYWDSGSELTRGRYYYRCTDGRLEPIGCINDDSQRIAKDESYISEGFEYRCVMDTEGYLYFEPAACVTSNGQRHQPGDTWDHPDGKAYWFKCQREYFYSRPYLSVKTQGCLVGVNSYRIEINETWDDTATNSWWQCFDRYDSTQLCLKGCIHNGERKESGARWEEGEYVYSCVNKNDRAIIECIGCMNEGRQLRSGDRYLRENQVYQCEILYDSRKRETKQEHKLIGCVERDRRGTVVGERTIGCYWSETVGVMKYEKRCTEKGEAMPVGCVMTKDGADYLFIPPNMYTIHHPVNGDPIYLACRSDKNGHLTSFNFDENELQGGSMGIGRLRGLRYAPPRG